MPFAAAAASCAALLLIRSFHCWRSLSRHTTTLGTFCPHTPIASLFCLCRPCQRCGERQSSLLTAAAAAAQKKNTGSTLPTIPSSIPLRPWQRPPKDSGGALPSSLPPTPLLCSSSQPRARISPICRAACRSTSPRTFSITLRLQRFLIRLHSTSIATLPPRRVRPSPRRAARLAGRAASARRCRRCCRRRRRAGASLCRRARASGPPAFLFTSLVFSSVSCPHSLHPSGPPPAQNPLGTPLLLCLLL